MSKYRLIAPDGSTVTTIDDPNQEIERFFGAEELDEAQKD